MHSIGLVRLVETKTGIRCQTCISHIMQCINSIIAWTFELSVYPFKNVLCSCSFDSCKWYSVWNSSLFQPENGTKDKHSAAVQCDCCSFVLCIPPFFLKKSRCTLMLQNIRYTKVETVTNVDTHPSSSSACFSLNTASRWRKPSMSKMQLYFTHLICNWKLKFIPLCALVCDHLDATLAACSHVCVVSKQSAENNGVVDRPLEIWHFPRRMSKKKRHCSGIAIRKSGDSDDVQWQWVTFNWRTLAQLL